MPAPPDLYKRRRVIILSGISGSGKSTLARKLCAQENEETEGQGQPAIVSADDYFTKGGVYTFDPSKLSEAHGECFFNFIGHMRHLSTLVVVDNTNTTEAEIAPYVLGAQAFDYKPEIWTLTRRERESVDSFMNRCFERSLHVVDFQVLEAQFRRMMKRRFPAHWHPLARYEDV
jgi:GTPase SAR1 family protein